MGLLGRPLCEKIKIIRIIARLNVGGPAKHVVWLMSGLNKDRFEQTLICGKVKEDEDDMSWFAERACVNPLVIPTMGRNISLVNDIVTLYHMYKIIKRERPDIVHTHTSKAGFLGRMAVLSLRIRNYLMINNFKDVKLAHTFHGHTLHSYFGSFKNIIFLTIERFLGRFTDRIIVLSRQQLDEISNKYRVGKKENFTIVPIGIDTEPFKDLEKYNGLLRGKYDSRERDIIISAMGRIASVKNYKMLIDVSSKFKVQSSKFRVHFFVFGGGSVDDVRGLDDYINEKNVSDIFHLAGNIDKPEEAWADTDIAVLTSLNEGTPVSLLEAMAAGKPVIATNVGGVIDLVGSEIDAGDNNESEDQKYRVHERGILVESGDVGGFVSGFDFLISNRKLLKSMGESGRRFVMNNYSKERLINYIEELYLEMNK